VALAEDAAEARGPANLVARLEQPVALYAAVHLRADAQLIAEAHLEPASHASGVHPGVEQLVGPAQEHVERLGRVTLLQRAVQQLSAVPGRRRDLEAIVEAQPRMEHRDLRHRVEGAPARELEAQLGEGLERPADAARGPPDPLRDGLDLAQAGGQEREDPVGLAVVEAREDDGVRHVEASLGHVRTVPPGPAMR